MKKLTALILCILAVFVLFTAAQADPEPEPEEEPYIRITAEFGEEGAEYPFLPLWDSSFFQIETNAAHNEEVLFFYDEGADPIPVWVDEEGFGQAWFTPGTVDCNIFKYEEFYNADNMVHNYTAHVETMTEDPADAVTSNEVEYQTGLTSAVALDFKPAVEGCADGALRRDDVFSASVTQDGNFQNMCIVLFDEDGEFAADSHWVGVDPDPEAGPLTIEVPLLRLEINKHYTAKIYALKSGCPMVYAQDQNGNDLEYDVLILSPSSQDEDSEIMIRGLKEEYQTGEMILPTVYYPNSEKMEDIQMEIQVFATGYEDDRRSWNSDLYLWPNEEEGETDLYYQPEIWDNPISSWNDGEHIFRVIVWQRQQDGDEFVEVDSTERTFMVTSEGPLPNPLDLPVVLYENQLPYPIEIERPDAEYFIIAAVAWDTRDGNFISSWEYSEWSEGEKFEITVDRADQCIEFYVEIGKQGYDQFRWAQRIPVIRLGNRITLETETGLNSNPLPLHTDIPLWVSAPGADWIRVENVYGEFFREEDQNRINEEFPIEFNDSIREEGTNPIVATAQFTDDEGESVLESTVLLFEGFAYDNAGDFTATIDPENSIERGGTVTVTYTKSEHADHYWTDVDVWNEDRQEWEWITHQADLFEGDGGTATLSTIELEPGAVYRFRALAEGEGYRTAEYIITNHFTVEETEIPDSGILVVLDKNVAETCEDVVVSAYARGAEWMEVYWDYGNNNWATNNDGGESRTWNHSYGHAGSHEIRVKAGRAVRDEYGNEIWESDDEGNEWPVQDEWWSDPVYVTITAPNGSLVLEAPELPDSYAPSNKETKISFTVNKPDLADYLHVSAWFDGDDRDIYQRGTGEDELAVSFTTDLPEGRTLQISIHAEKQGYDSADLTLSIPVLDLETVSNLVVLSVGEGDITFDPQGLATVPIHGNVEFLVGAAEDHTLDAVKLYCPNGWWNGGEEVTPENHGDWFRNGKAFFWTDFGDDNDIGRNVPIYALARIDGEEEWIKSQILWVHVLEHKIGSYSFTGETNVTARRGEDVEFTFTPAEGADEYWVDAWDIHDSWESFQPGSVWEGTKVTMSTASLPEGEYIVRGRAGAGGKGWRESDNSARLTVTASTVPEGDVRLTVNKTEALTEEAIYASAYAPGADWIEIIRRNEEGREDDFANDGGEGTSGRFSDGYPQTYQVFARAHYFERDEHGEPIPGIDEWGNECLLELPWEESETVEVRISAPDGEIELDASGIPASARDRFNLELSMPYPEHAEYMNWELFLNRDFEDDEQMPDYSGQGAINLNIPGGEIALGNIIELRVGAGATGYEHNHQDYQIRVIGENPEKRITLAISKNEVQVNEDFTVTITVDKNLNPDFVQYYDGDQFRRFGYDGYDSENLPLDKNNQWIFDEENFNESGVRMMYARAWLPDENEEDGGYWIESDPVKLTLTRTGKVEDFFINLQPAVVTRGEMAVVNYTVADNSDEKCYELHHDREREDGEEWIDYRLDWARDDDKHQFTFSTAGMPAGEYRLRVWARGEQGYEGRESSSVWLTVNDNSVPEGEVRLFIDKTKALTNEKIAVGALAPGADWIEIIRRNEDGWEDDFANDGGDSTSGTLDENHAATVQVFARAHYFKRDENGDLISTGINDHGDDIWEELRFVDSEIVEVRISAPNGRIEQDASGIPAYAVEGTDLNLRMPYPEHAEYMSWDLCLNRHFDGDEQEPDYSGNGELDLLISGGELEAGNTIELRVWVGGRGYEHNHQNYRIRVIAGHEDKITLEVSKNGERIDEVLVNEKLSVTITVDGELAEGERVRYYNGNEFWRYHDPHTGWDNYDLELDEGHWIYNDESFGGTGVVILYACIIPAGQDENEAAWTISDPVKVTVTREGMVEDFTVSLQPATVTRGETVILNYTVGDHSDEESYDLRHDRDEWIDYNLDWHRDNVAHQFTFSTADMPAGVYRLSVFAGGVQGYEGRESRTLFLTVEEPTEPTIAFEVTKSTVLANEDFQVGVYAPGADWTEVCWHENDTWNNGGDSWTGTYRYGNSGTYQIFARAWYPVFDDQNKPVWELDEDEQIVLDDEGNPVQQHFWVESDRITITVNSNGEMILMDLNGIPGTFTAGTDMRVTVPRPDDAEFMGWEIFIDGMKYADDANSNDGSINEMIPGDMLVEGGTVHIKVWANAVGYENNHREFWIPVVGETAGNDVTFTVDQEEIETCDNSLICTATFPAGVYSWIEIFDGESYRGEGIGDAQTQRVWADDDAIGFGIPGTYTVYARLRRIDDGEWVYTENKQITVTAPNGPLSLDTSGIPAQLFAGSGKAEFTFGQIKDQDGEPVDGAWVNYELYYEDEGNRTDLIAWDEVTNGTVTIPSAAIADGRVFRLNYNAFWGGYEPVMGGVDIPVVAAPTVTMAVDRKTMTYGEVVTFTVNAPGAESVQVRRLVNGEPGGEIALDGFTWTANEIGTIRFYATATYKGFGTVSSAQPVSVTVRTIGPAPAPTVIVPETVDEGDDIEISVTPAGGWAAVSIFASGAEPVYEKGNIKATWTYTIEDSLAGEYQVFVSYGQDGYDDGTLIEKAVRVAYVYGEPDWNWDGDFRTATATFTSMKGDDVQVIPAEITSEVTTEPTCDAEGKKTYTATASFQDQDYTVEKTETLPKEEHDWGEPEFTWSETGSGYSATATFTCENFPAHTRTETAEVTLIRTIDATCTEPEKMIYRAVCEDYRENQTFTGSDELGHDWEWEIIWNYDYTAYAERECGRCGETETAEVDVVSTVTKEATCSSRGEITYTASATLDGREVTSSKKQFTPKTAHIPGEPAFSDDFLFINTHCSVCGVILKAEEHGEQHLWGEPEYVWAYDNSSVTATRICGAAAALPHAETETVAAEVKTIIVEPTCEEAGIGTFTSGEFENTAFSVQTLENATMVPLGHEWSEPTYEWAYDNRKVKAFRICGRDEEHTETEEVGVTVKITSPTDKKAGKAIFTSNAFTMEGCSVQTKTVDIPALNENALWLPSGLTVIESEAFSNLACQAVIIQDGCTAIGENAFRGCVNLKYVRIPASVPKDSWPATAFEDCSPDLVIDYAGD